MLTLARHQHTLTRLRWVFFILAAGASGAGAAVILETPLPYLIGSLLITASVSMIRYAMTGNRIWFPEPLRRICIGTIGVMTGATFSINALEHGTSLAVTLPVMAVFVVLLHRLNFLIFYTLGSYDRDTALFAAMPGGLIEAALMAEKSGADIESVSLQHFIRIILVILIVPTLFWIVSGIPVGSTAGESLSRGPAQWHDGLLLAVLVGSGIVLGRILKLPAGHLIGPLILTALLSISGWIDLHLPAFLLNVAQWIIGTSLGILFARTTGRYFLTALSLGGLSVGSMLGIGAIFAWGIADWVSVPFSVLLISFAPGGITEMSLIALTLGVSPVWVTGHHLFRIITAITIVHKTKKSKIQMP